MPRIQNQYLAVWREACKKNLKGGTFKKIPRKGTPEHKKLYAMYQDMLLNSHPTNWN